MNYRKTKPVPVVILTTDPDEQLRLLAVGTGIYAAPDRIGGFPSLQLFYIGNGVSMCFADFYYTDLGDLLTKLQNVSSCKKEVAAYSAQIKKILQPMNRICDPRSLERYARNCKRPTFEERKDGVIIRTYEAGVLTFESHMDRHGHFQGYTRIWDSHGNLIGDEFYADNVWDGKQRAWKDGNIIYCLNYKKGKMDGINYWYKPNGSMVVGYYRDGVLELLQIYDGKGFLIRETHFKDGKICK